MNDRFVNSWSGNQLRADGLTDTGTCEPLRRNGSDDDTGSVFLPCGVIGNSFFNGILCLCVGCISLLKKLVCLIHILA